MSTHSRVYTPSTRLLSFDWPTRGERKIAAQLTSHDMARIAIRGATVKIALGTDHAGFEFKNQLANILTKQGIEVLEVGAHSYDAEDDYPDFSEAVARAVADGQAERGILVCGSGVGASIAANKIKGIRAAMCHDTYSAHQGVEHDDMNVLCMGARIIGIELAREIATAFLGASFSGEPRHARRLAKVMAIEAAN